MRTIILFNLFVLISLNMYAQKDTITTQNNDTLEVVKNSTINDFFSNEIEGTDEAGNVSSLMNNMLGGMLNSMMWVVITIYILIFCIIIGILIMFVNYKIKKGKNRQLLISKYIENNQEVPEYLLKDGRSKQDYLKKSIIWILAGIGIWIVFGIVGIIPVLIGVAYLIIAFVEKKTDKQNAEDEK